MRGLLGDVDDSDDLEEAPPAPLVDALRAQLATERHLADTPDERERHSADVALIQA